jgi:hypothetical protein
MALLKFELKEDHIKLLKHLKWSLKSNQITTHPGEDDDTESPFGGDDLFEDMNLILNGKPENFDPMNSEGVEINEDEVVKLNDLFNQLPTALDIILFTGKFEPGHYKTKWYDRNWIKIN